MTPHMRVIWGVGLIALAPCAAITTAPGAVHAQAPDLETFVDSIVAATADAGRLAGTSIGVVQGGQPLLIKAYGEADLEWSVPMPVDAIFEIGSVTKQFTSVAALLLWEQGELDLDADLTDYLPDYDTQGKRVPVRRLLDHTSGIQGYTEMASAMTELATRSLPRDTLVSLVEAEPFQFEPGGAVIYNNSAFFLLGLIIEAVSGQDYADFLEEHVFPVADMDDTSYCTNDEVWERRAHGYSVGPNGLERADYLDHTWPYAAGSLCSTVPDLLDWIAALHAGEVLGEEAYDLLITPQGLADGTPTRYASGLVQYDGPGGHMIGHGGGINGFVSETRYYPEHDASVVVLVNATGSLDPSGTADAIGEHLFGASAPATGTYTGDVAALVGEYRGPIRGNNEAAVRVDLDEDGRLILRGLGPVQPLAFVEGTTFARGVNRYTFTLEDGVPTRLDADQIYGHYVMTPTSLGPVVEVEVDPRIMQRHVGRYHLVQLSVEAAVTMEAGSLWIEIPGQPRLRMVPDGDLECHIAEAPASFTFEVVNGETVVMVVKQGGAVLRAARVGR